MNESLKINVNFQKVRPVYWPSAPTAPASSFAWRENGTWAGEITHINSWGGEDSLPHITVAVYKKGSEIHRVATLIIDESQIDEIRQLENHVVISSDDVKSLVQHVQETKEDALALPYVKICREDIYEVLILRRSSGHWESVVL